MRYFYGHGVVVRNAKKVRGAILVAVAAILVLSQLALLPHRADAVEQDGPTQTIGEIQGLIYHDVLGDGDQGPGDLPLENWKGWLLTHNSPFTLAAEDTTDADGLFLFEDLPFGTYYVCQDLQDGWFQTELAAIGIGLDTVAVGDILGDSEALDALVDEFCYEVILTPENPTSNSSIFGNFQPPEDPKEALGESVARGDDPGANNGNVLSASTTGQVLAATGQSTYWPILLGVSLLFGSLLSIKLARNKQ